MASCKFNKASLISLIIATALLAGCGGGGSGGTVQGLSAPSIVKDCPERAYDAAKGFLLSKENLISGVQSISSDQFLEIQIRTAQNTIEGFETLLATTRTELEKIKKELPDKTATQASTEQAIADAQAKLDAITASETATKADIAQTTSEINKAKEAHTQAKVDLEKAEERRKNTEITYSQLQIKIAADKKLLADIKANTINFSNLDVDDKCFASLNLDYTKVHAINFSNSKITEATVKHILKQLKPLEKKNIALKHLDLTNTTISKDASQLKLLRTSFKDYSICLSSGNTGFYC